MLCHLLSYLCIKVSNEQLKGGSIPAPSSRVPSIMVGETWQQAQEACDVLPLQAGSRDLSARLPFSSLHNHEMVLPTFRVRLSTPTNLN